MYHINQLTSGILYFFQSPVRDYFQWKFGKKFLAIKNFSVNETMSGQPNKRLSHWHFHKRVNSFIDGSAFCPGTPNRDPTDSEKHLHVYTSAQWHATGDVLTRLPAKTHKNRNACLDALRSPFQQKIASLYGIRCELVKVTIQYWYSQKAQMITDWHKTYLVYSWWWYQTSLEMISVSDVIILMTLV